MYESECKQNEKKSTQIQTQLSDFLFWAANHYIAYIFFLFIIQLLQILIFSNIRYRDKWNSHGNGKKETKFTILYQPLFSSFICHVSFALSNFALSCMLYATFDSLSSPLIPGLPSIPIKALGKLLTKYLTRISFNIYCDFYIFQATLSYNVFWI